MRAHSISTGMLTKFTEEILTGNFIFREVRIDSVSKIDEL